MPSRPPRPVGSSKWAIAAQDDWDYKYDPKRGIIRDTPQYTVDKYADGTMKLNLKPSKGGSGGGFHWAAAGRHYDQTKSYSGDKTSAEEVWVWPTDTIVTDGVTDPDSKVTVYAKPGLYRCLQNVAPVVNPVGLPAGTYYRIPQATLPSVKATGSYDLDDPLNYWLFIAGVNVC